MIDYRIRQITDEQTLKRVLDMCYSILGAHHEGLYSYKSWCSRLNRPYLLLYAEWEGAPIAAVLGRAENADGVVVGFAACREEFRRKGIIRYRPPVLPNTEQTSDGQN